MVAASCGSDDDGDSAPATEAPAAEPEAEPEEAAPEPEPEPAEEPAESEAEAPTTEAPPAELEIIPLRWSTISTASQGYLPSVIIEQGIDEEFGFDLEILELSGTGQQWTALRGDETDISSGSVLDLARQRATGLEAKGLTSFLAYNSPIVVLDESEIATFGDLAGSTVGTPNAGLLDYLIIRAAGTEAYGVDVGEDAELAEAAPGLLNEFIRNGEIDATLQFSSLAFAPLATGEMRALTDVRTLMGEGGFNPDALYLLYVASEDWLEENPDRVDELYGMINAGIEVLQTDDSVWPALAEVSGVEDPALLDAFVAEQRAVLFPPYSADLIAPTDELIQALIGLIGEAEVGTTGIDPDAFVFPAS
ncbi:MAG: ABC transporter substrate-binding protein [Ilumatobacter sp.]|uniref:ABC transporter substrate-binding protein n=1 Tax=Ilumatobacter sp. TaxID=1967498 RepID=UPI00391A5901